MLPIIGIFFDLQIFFVTKYYNGSCVLYVRNGSRPRLLYNVTTADTSQNQFNFTR